MQLSVDNSALILICFHILCSLLGTTVAAPSAPLDKLEENKSEKQPQLIPGTVNLVKYANSKIGVDGYDFAFETSDGVSRKETATVKNLGTDEEAISVEGTVSWVGPDGIHYTLNYLADENGFQPEGQHLPVAPES